MLGADVIRSLPHSNNETHISEFGWVLLKVQAPVVWDTGGQWLK